ncbi:MAG: pyrroloquinoline quinone biosynthesis protein PqqB [Gammaproteobacteria bacterium]|nr:pyrroloquinoline quinone biosynthesis protein PqqB [Gammaproteobacteria bacterium]
MQVVVLGAAAGGGFPQWNCRCSNCSGLRDGTLNAEKRTQSSIAISADGNNWLLCNASPDILAQLSNTPVLHPMGLRESPIKAILFADSQIDHTTGLLMLREGCPHQVYCSDMVYQDLTTGFPIFTLLESWNGGIAHNTLPIGGESFNMPEVPGLSFKVYAIEGKAPPYSPHRHDPHPGDNIALVVIDEKSGSKLIYAPGVYTIPETLKAEMQDSDCILIDGTFWQEDEMAVNGVGKKTAKDMGHLPQSGEGGMIEQLKAYEKSRKVLIHINNTNPILVNDSAERGVLDEEGIEVAYDGMEIVL